MTHSYWQWANLAAKRGTMELKNDDVYALPDGTEFVARVGPKGVYFLHALRLGRPSAPVYVVDGSGQFLSEGRRTRWHVGDLHATGRTSRPEIQRIGATDEALETGLKRLREVFNRVLSRSEIGNGKPHSGEQQVQSTYDCRQAEEQGGT